MTEQTDTTDGAGLDREWWKEAVAYQVYPTSFNDTDGDGVGDLRGVIEKVDYLDELGVDLVWLNPVYESPMSDNGYDIADYRSINPRFGTMDDWERLLEALHDRDMRLIMDLVVNHTSDEHDWFLRSRRGESGYVDYYHWRPGDPPEEGGELPNNWSSFFEETAWTYDEERGEYYLHLFDRKQPDLNWREEAVREEVYDLMNWWLDKGIDGFRMDVINLISKREGLPDGDPENAVVGGEHFVSGPEFERYLSEMVSETLEGRDVTTVGETVGVTAEEAPAYVGEDGLSMLIHFEHMLLDAGEGGKWDPAELDVRELKQVFTRWQTELADEGWNCLYFSNHDQPRAVSRFGDDGEYRRESAKLLGTVLFTLRGTPFVYQGQEIGMTNADFPSPADLRDVESTNFVERMLETDEYDSYEQLRPLLEERSRDNARTPVQWTDGEHAGFTDGEPWIDVNDNHSEINVAAARADEDSVWHYYRDLIDLRDGRDVLVYGDYDLLLPDHPTVFAYRRTLGEETVVAAHNFDDGGHAVELPLADSERLIGNHPERDGVGDELELRPYETVVRER